MFKKLHEAIMKVSGQIHAVDQFLAHIHSQMLRDGEVTDKRFDSIETWLELAVDAKADEVAERFDKLLAESRDKRVTNDTLKELVRQAVKGQ